MEILCAIFIQNRDTINIKVEIFCFKKFVFVLLKVKGFVVDCRGGNYCTLVLDNAGGKVSNHHLKLKKLFNSQ